MAKKPTITNVARLAGVSTATTGRVLGGYGYSSQDVRDRVFASAEQLGYTPNQLARSLITGTTRTIGVVAGDIQSPFYASVLRGIYNVARLEGFGLLVTGSDELLKQEIESVELLLAKQVDGLIIAPLDLRDAQHLRKVMDSGKPIVQIDRIIEGFNADYVVVDNFKASYEATLSLIKAGHRSIGVVAELEHSNGKGIEEFIAAARLGTVDPQYLFPSWQRVYGYLRAMLQSGCEINPDHICRVGEYSVTAGQSRVEEMMTQSIQPTAVFSTGGLLSVAVMHVLDKLNLSIPDDLSLVCFDDLDWFSFNKPQISAIKQPTIEMGEEAARLIFNRMKNTAEPQQGVQLKTTFINRFSTRNI